MYQNANNEENCLKSFLCKAQIHYIFEKRKMCHVSSFFMWLFNGSDSRLDPTWTLPRKGETPEWVTAEERRVAVVAAVLRIFAGVKRDTAAHEDHWWVWKMRPLTHLWQERVTAQLNCHKSYTRKCSCHQTWQWRHRLRRKCLQLIHSC